MFHNMNGAGLGRRIVLRWVFPALILFPFAGCGDEGKVQQARQEQLPQVGVEVLELRDVITTTELTGRVASHATAEVRPQVNGIILRRMFEEGSEVKAGQQLYQIDPSMYQAQYETALAAQQKAQTAVINAKSVADRYAEIVKVRGVSQQEYDNALAQYRLAQADVASAEAAVKTARINLDYTRVFSPVSGRVGISSVTEGALVTAGQSTPLVSVQQMDPMYIDITQSSADFLRLQRSLQSGVMASAGENAVGVRLILEDGLPYEHEARMMLYDATVNQSTGSITMRATVQNPENLLLPGMFVRAVVTEGITENALLVPLEAVQRTPRGEAMVLIVNGQGLVEQRVINTSRIYDNSAWIVLPGRSGEGAGLEAGDKVIVEGVNRVRAGVPAATYIHGEKAGDSARLPDPALERAGS
ncbi:MAG: efflux RND transporter periplasmic adaptor subunit [Deltaproteobacteria bacterium]|nr:efflux RND transporter periplasmic adaptor subunit [Deltaproteobacteria bacterium]